jgi:predicted acetyltransferase
MSLETFSLVWPAQQYLPSFVEALQRGWSPDTLRPEASMECLEQIAQDPELFLSQQIDIEAKRPRVVLRDGSTAPCLPSYVQWMWDGEFCGSINLRWQPGTEELPPYVLGHVGYSVVPWKQRRGYATSALRLFLPQVQNEGHKHVDVVTGAQNVASQRVVLANGGKFIERFKSPLHGDIERCRYRISLII